jgi:acyl-coenzyme A synthetase/AMP-(fatty) acid ligase
MKQGRSILLGTDDAIAVLYDGTPVTYAALRARSCQLAELIGRHDVHSSLVRSDHPVHILCALECCARTGTDLYLAHTSLRDEVVRELLDSMSIQLEIGERDEIRSVVGSRQRCGCICIMSSGTSGTPKIARHTLRSLIDPLHPKTATGRYAQSRWLLTYQPTGFAGIQVMLTASMSGGALVSSSRRNVAGFCAVARSAEVSHISGTPTFWRAFLMTEHSQELPLQQVTLGGEPTDQATLDRLAKIFSSARITHTYASTEAGMVYTVSDRRAGFPREWLDDPRRPIQLRVREGLLQVKSSRSMLGYLNQLAHPVIEDGWLVTGDQCEVRGDRAHVIGRADKSIKVGGALVVPSAVESFIVGLPGVLDARVYGVPNPVSGYLVGADVVLAANRNPSIAQQEIVSSCRTGLERHAVPCAIRIVDSLSLGPSWKKN